MKKLSGIGIFLAALFSIFQSCKKETVVPTDFSQLTATTLQCRDSGAIDTTQWINDVLNYYIDTALLTFTDNIITADSFAGKISISPTCPNPSNGFFIWHIDAARECKLRLVCINEKYEILYYNVYHLKGGPMEIGFDFSDNTAFKKGSNYRMFYGFYNSFDSVYYAGHGNFKVQ